MKVEICEPVGSPFRLSGVTRGDGPAVRLGTTWERKTARPWLADQPLKYNEMYLHISGEKQAIHFICTTVLKSTVCAGAA
jgi:hypothetical protein